MQHVADGILHAYLDGALDALADAGELPNGATAADVRAHFDECADCRARLDEAREVKARAGRVLQDAGSVVVDMPPFEVVTGSARTQRGRRSWLPLSWAASVLLAVGAGWWGNEIRRAEDARMAVESHQDAAGETSPLAGETSPLAGAATAAAPADRTQQDVPASAAEPAAAGRSARAEPAPATAPSVHASADRAPPNVAATPPSVDAAVSGADAAVSSAEAAQRAAVARLGAAVPADAVPLVPTTTPVEQLVRTEPIGMAVQESADPVRATDTALQLFREQAASLRADPSAWRALSATGVDSLRTVFVIDDAGTATFEVARPTLGMSSLVRVRQQLATGEQVELLVGRSVTLKLDEIVVTGSDATTQRPTAAIAAGQAALGLAAGERTAGAQRAAVAAPDSAPRRAPVDVVSSETFSDGMAEIVVRMPDTDTYVVIRGALSPGELADLARRLVRAPRR
jgi:hypothetical protein